MSDLPSLDSSPEPRPRLRMAVPHDDPHRTSSHVESQYQPATGREVHLLDYVRVLYKRRWLAGTAFVIVVVGVGVNTLTTTPIYQARTEILIEKENTNVVTFKQAIDQNQTADDYYQTQYKILQSRALARKTIEALKLWDH